MKMSGRGVRRGADHLGLLGHDKQFSFIPIQWEATDLLKEEKQGMISCMN